MSIVQKAIDAIQHCHLGELKNANFLTKLILEFGLFPLNSKKVPPSYRPFCGKGLLTWQAPEQLADYLIFVGGQNIRTYVECGVAAGGTAILTLEYLRRFQPEIRGYGFDPYIHRDGRTYSESHLIREYVGLNRNFSLIEDYARNCRRYITGTIDLVFIDSDHSYSGVSEDFQTFDNMCRMIALHDIIACNGVMIKWQLLKQERQDLDFYEFCRLPADFETPDKDWCLYGIGLMKKVQNVEVKLL